MEYAYARVSTRDQNLERQIKAFKELGIDEKHIITDKQSGKGFDRKGYNLLTGTERTAPLLRKGDLLTVYSIDRLGRNYGEIKREWQKITMDIGADIRILDMPLLDTRTGGDSLDRRFIADLVLEILSYCAEKEHVNIRSRQAEGYAAMKTDSQGRKVSSRTGKHIGRQEIEKPNGYDATMKKWQAGDITAVEAMQELGLKKGTFYKMARAYGYMYV